MIRLRLLTTVPNPPIIYKWFQLILPVQSLGLMDTCGICLLLTSQECYKTGAKLGDFLEITRSVLSRAGHFWPRVLVFGFQVRLSHIPAADFSSGSQQSAKWFHPTDTPFFLKKKRERERKTSPVVSVRCVSSRRGSAKTRAGERLRGWERVRESRRGREKEWRVWTSAKLREADRYKTESAAEREGKEWKSKRNTHGRQRKKYKTLKTRPAEKWTSCSLWWPGFFVPVARIP